MFAKFWAKLTVEEPVNWGWASTEVMKRYQMVVLSASFLPKLDMLAISESAIPRFGIHFKVDSWEETSPAGVSWKLYEAIWILSLRIEICRDEKKNLVSNPSMAEWRFLQNVSSLITKKCPKWFYDHPVYTVAYAISASLDWCIKNDEKSLEEEDVHKKLLNRLTSLEAWSLLNDRTTSARMHPCLQPFVFWDRPKYKRPFGDP